MTLRHKKRISGFSLIELAIVLGVVGVIIGAVWAYANSARQTSRLEKASEALTQIVENVRSAYTAQASISGKMETVANLLDQAGAMPSVVARPTTSTCNTTTAIFADTPWPGSDSCGTLRICPWLYGVGATGSVSATPCASVTALSAGQQFFAIEFTQLDYGSCSALAAQIAPGAPAGLVDVYINGYSAIKNGGGVLPVPPSLAASQGGYVGEGCTAGSFTNIIDFVYTLRPPISS